MSAGGAVENRLQEVSADLAGPEGARDASSRCRWSRSRSSRAPWSSATDKRPELSDLRESGSIEQDADIVMFIYRDEYYNDEESEPQGIAELIFAKQRNGPTGTIELAFMKRFAKFASHRAA